MKKPTTILLSELSKIEFDNESLDEMTNKLNELETYVSSICDVKSDNEIYDFEIGDIDELREDIVKESLSQEDALKNAAKSKNGYIQFPRRK
ncbi:MAG TPA: Asp-tRNA(Asn)/Glu-tRNA(Gln) amidotransferase subunit GatC [Clostridiales bacterium]|nr:Asp-tRNA(Asn)/Glu-tRNA(Gln) amidotransferase subunit GatC [Clostridiales bacterium]